MNAPNVLVAVASKHGATAEIGERVAEALTEAGVTATAVAANESTPVEGYDAFVIGSAVYAGRWRSDARDFVRSHKQELAARPVWLFSSGPVAEPPSDAEDPIDIEEMSVLTTSRDHRIFCGLLNSAKLGVLERAVVHALGAPEGDYRDWPAIEAWARDIAAELLAER